MKAKVHGLRHLQFMKTKTNDLFFRFAIWLQAAFTEIIYWKHLPAGDIKKI